MKPTGGSVPSRAILRILVPEMDTKSSLRFGSKNAIFLALGDDLYHMWHGQTMLQVNPTLNKNMKLLPFHFASYDTEAKKMAFFDPKRADKFQSISGTKMRKMAREGTTPPVGFMDPDGWQVLVKFYQGLKAEL